jgi:hypothetical protein
MADPLRFLVLVIILLALAGTAVGTAYYYSVELPLKNIEKPPENYNYGGTICQTCYDKCMSVTSDNPAQCVEKCISERQCKAQVDYS